MVILSLIQKVKKKRMPPILQGTKTLQNQIGSTLTLVIFGVFVIWWPERTFRPHYSKRLNINLIKFSI